MGVGAQAPEALTAARCTRVGLSSPAPAPAGRTRPRNRLVMWRSFAKTSLRELPSPPHTLVLFEAAN